GLRIDLAQVAAVRERIVLPADASRDAVAGLEFGVLGLHDLAHHFARHHLADLDLGRIGARIVHAAAHIGIEREIETLHHHLAVAHGRQRRLNDTEIALAY